MTCLQREKKSKIFQFYVCVFCFRGYAFAFGFALAPSGSRPRFFSCVKRSRGPAKKGINQKKNLPPFDWAEPSFYAGVKNGCTHLESKFIQFYVYVRASVRLRLRVRAYGLATQATPS